MPIKKPLSPQIRMLQTHVLHISITTTAPALPFTIKNRRIEIQWYNDDSTEFIADEQNQLEPFFQESHTFAHFALEWIFYSLYLCDFLYRLPSLLLRPLLLGKSAMNREINRIVLTLALPPLPQSQRNEKTKKIACTKISLSKDVKSIRVSSSSLKRFIFTISSKTNKQKLKYSERGEEASEPESVCFCSNYLEYCFSSYKTLLGYTLTITAHRHDRLKAH